MVLSPQGPWKEREHKTLGGLGRGDRGIALVTVSMEYADVMALLKPHCV